jgi:type 1 glutamine amidotransferase
MSSLQCSENNQTTLLVFIGVEKGKGRHDVTPTAIESIRELVVKDGFDIHVTEDPAVFTQEQLKKYTAVILLNARGDVLNDNQQSAFQKYLKNGKGVAILHAGLLAEEEWPWLTKLTGARFTDHPKIQEATVMLADKTNIINKGLPDSWTHHDEWYNFDVLPEGCTILLLVDEATYEGGKHGDHHPIAWCNEFEGARMFYTAMGHTEESWHDAIFMKHILGGIRYVINGKR